MNRTRLIRLLFVSGALLGSAWNGVSAQNGGPMITITPVNGVANTFELVRVYPDKVEVRREGIRLNFSREAIKSVKNLEASEVLDEARAILAEVAEENLDKIPGLLERAERTAPRIDGVVEKFDWLIPEATQTLLDTQKSLFALRDTARAAERLSMLDTLLTKMAAGTATLSATWEQVVDQGLEVTDAIPFPKIQKDFQDRFARMRREIRLDLSDRRTRSLERIRTIGEDLLAQAEAGTLNESRSTLALNELDRFYEGILDADAKQEIAGFVEKVKETTTRGIEKAKTVAVFTEAAEAVRALKQGLESGTIAPATGERIPELERARSLLATAPDSATKEILSVDLSDLEVQVARAMAASVPRPAGGDDLVTTGGGGEAPLPGDGAEDDSLIGTIKRNLGMGAGLGAGAVVALVAIMILAGRMMKKKKAEVAEATPEFTTQYDIFKTEPEGGAPRFSPSPVTSAIAPKPAPPAPVDDAFGFGEEESQPEPAPVPKSAPLSTAPDPTADLVVEDDLFNLSFEEEEEEAPAPEPPPTAAVPDDPFAPTTLDMEEDLFGLGEATEEDPLGLTARPQPPAPQPEPPQPAPQPSKSHPTSADDDPFGFNNLLSEEDDLFADKDSKE